MQITQIKSKTIYGVRRKNLPHRSIAFQRAPLFSELLPSVSDRENVAAEGRLSKGFADADVLDEGETKWEYSAPRCCTLSGVVYICEGGVIPEDELLCGSNPGMPFRKAN